MFQGHIRVRGGLLALLVCLGIGGLGIGCTTDEAGDPGTDRLVVPGERLGAITLGLGRAEVHRRLGTPHRVWSPSADSSTVLEGWMETADHHFFVYYQAERVVQLHATAPTYATAEGLSTESTLDAFRARFAPLQPLINPYETGITYYDALMPGLAFAFADATGEAHAVFVHRPGVEVLIF